MDGANGSAPRDPKRLAARIVALASRDDVPPRLVFADDACEWAGAQVDRLREEVARSTDGG